MRKNKQFNPLGFIDKIFIRKILLLLLIIFLQGKGHFLWAKKTEPDSYWQQYGFSLNDLKNASKNLKTFSTLAEIASLLSSYPKDISSIIYKNNDWVLIFYNKEELYWAEGRILPSSMRKNYIKYRKYICYYYPKSVENPNNFSNKKIHYIKNNYTKDKLSQAPGYEGKFYEILYKSSTQSSIEKQLISLNFLHQKIPVHSKIAPKISILHKKIMEMAKYNTQIAKFIKSIHAMHSYSWRKIRGTQSRSFHSFAVAIDIIPKNKNKIIYWRWEESKNSDWFLEPLKKRWEPPQTIINLFEEYGFIWGGRWILYDNMHFEYRPELLQLQKHFHITPNAL